MTTKEKLLHAVAEWDNQALRNPSSLVDDILHALREPSEAALAVGREELDTCLNLDPCGMAEKHVFCTMIEAIRGGA